MGNADRRTAASQIPRSGRLITEEGHYVNAGNLVGRMLTGMTSFDELLTASMFPQIELQSAYGITALRDKTTETNGASVTGSGGEYTLTTGAQANSVARLESAERGRYLPGMEGIPGIAVRIETMPTGDAVMRWGYFDDNNGFGVLLDAQGLATFLRSGGSDTVVRREDWLDSLDGEGRSGFTLELNKVTIWRFPYRWYGSGPVAFEVSVLRSNAEGEVATFQYSGPETGAPILENPNLPVRAEVDNGANTSAATLYVLGRHYSVIGNFEPDFRVTHELRTGATVGTGGLVPLVSFRIKTGFEGRGVKLGGLDVLSDNDLRLVILWAPSLTGASFGTPTDGDADETAIETDVSATGLTGGIPIYGTLAQGGGFFSGGQTIAELPSYDMPWDGTVITVAAVALSAEAAVNALLRIREEW